MSPSPKGLSGSLRTSLLRVFASAGEKAGSREWPSDAKAASSNTKVAGGDLESRRTGPRKIRLDRRREKSDGNGIPAGRAGGLAPCEPRPGSWMGPDGQASIRDRESNSARVPYGDSTYSLRWLANQ